MIFLNASWHRTIATFTGGFQLFLKVHLNADDHELVGIDHHQETGCTDQTLRPNAGVTDRQTNDLCRGHVPPLLLPGMC